MIETEKITIIFTTSKYQKKDINSNISSINLGECEILLRNYYNISINETLYMKKLDIVQEGMKTKKVEYDVYSKLSGKNLIKLNLTVCKNSKGSISLPFELMESLDIFNSSSGYYNDICYTTTSDVGTDLSLKDRKNEYVNGNKMICQDDCDFANYDYDTLKAKCSCKVKESSSSFIDMNINKTKILENIKEIKNFANFKFLICHKKLFTKKGLLNNIGSYLILVIILTHIINIFLFYIKQLPLINKKIKDIVFGIKNYELIESDKKKNKKKKKFKKDINIIDNSDQNQIITSNTVNKVMKKKKKNKRRYSKNIHINNKNLNNISNKNENKTNNIGENIIPIIEDNGIIKSKSKKIKEKKDEKVKEIMKYIDEEINSLSYELAIQYDKRTYCEYYLSLLKTKHNIIFALFNNNDYNSLIIKIDLFFVGFTIYYTTNALFYSDDTMHKIYQNKGKYNIEEQIPIIIFSSIISTILNTLLKLLALSNDSII